MADILTDLKQNVESQYNDVEIVWAVTHPQYWTVNQINSLRKSLQMAGIEGKLLSEPNAAQFAYRAGENMGQVTSSLVADVGAGTIDFSLMKEEVAGIYEDVGVGGDAFLGSSDADKMLLDALAEELRAVDGFKETSFEEQQPELLMKMKEMKHKLAALPTVREKIFGCTEIPFVFEVNVAKKKIILKPMYEGFIRSLEKTFENAAKSSNKEMNSLKDEVEVVYLVGGGMKDKYFAEMLQTVFPKARIVGRPNERGTLNPDEVVAVGAAYWAAAKSHVKVIRGLPAEPITLKVTPMAVGVECVHFENNNGERNTVSWFRPIIQSNKPIPCKEEEEFTVAESMQPNVVVSVYQGDGDKTTDDGVDLIGKYTIPVEMPSVKDQTKVMVQMEITEEMKLIVRAKEKGEWEVQEYDNIFG